MESPILPLDFVPAAPRARCDGWTAGRQRAFIAALAECGIVRKAAERVGMTERSARRLRGRADAADFDRAWIEASRLGRSRPPSATWERAVVGIVKPYRYRGEIVGGNRVYDNRLLMLLLGKAERARTDRNARPNVDVDARVPDEGDRLYEEDCRRRDLYFAGLGGVFAPTYPELCGLSERKGTENDACDARALAGAGQRKICQPRPILCTASAMAAPFSPSRRARLGPADWLMLAEALAALALASLAIALLPFRRVAAAASAPLRAPAPPDDRTVRRVRSAVKAWARRVPWRTVCFQKGLALHWMLRRRGIDSVLLYGARRDGDGLAAHVWVDVGGETVIGGEEAPGFACLARFPPDEA